jgi:hypothetical protein
MKLEMILRWIARVWGLASTLLLLAFAFGGREHLRFTLNEGIAFLFFPIGLILGLGVVWWREGLGGLISIVSLALFYLFMFAVAGKLPAGPYFLLFAAPGFLHFWNGWRGREPPGASPRVEPRVPTGM